MRNCRTWRAGVAALATMALGAPVPAASSAPCSVTEGRPWCDESLPAGERADLLIEAMRRGEKISLLAGDQLPDVGIGGGPDQHPAASLGVPRLAIPRTNFVNGPAGVRQGRATALPAPLALAATWKPDLAREAGAVTGDEAAKKGNDFVYAPTVNIMRTPVGGRTFEAYGEDPVLAANMTVGWIEGAQDEGVIAVVKHFAANNQEGYAGPEANSASPRMAQRWLRDHRDLVGDRKHVNVHVDARTLHEVYYPHFEAAVRQADVGAVMCAHNKVNGTHACRNRVLLEKVLRREWGFRGVVLSDHTAARDTASSLRSGLDFEPWPGTTYGPQAVEAALEAGAVSMRDVQRRVFHILRTMFAHGVFDRAGYVNDPSRIDVRGHADVARRIEQSAITLLENRDEVLPLRPDQLDSVAVIGPGAAEYAYGGGSSKVRPFFRRTPLSAIERVLRPTTELRYDNGRAPARAAAIARGADVALVFVRDFIAERADRSCLTLECPDEFGEQDALIRAVAAANPRTVVVMETGGPVLTPWRDKVDGLLEAWYPGEVGGTAIARVLFGSVDPGGRLPATFPRRARDIPTAGGPRRYPGVDDQVFYKEGMLVGYRWYDGRDLRPAYPFGFGRSYTTFRLRRLRVEPAGSDGSVVATVRLRVTNTGEREGKAVPQLYLSAPERRRLPQPPKALKDFETLSLDPGERHTVTMRLHERDLAHWATATKKWRTSGGCYRVRLGSSSRDLPLEAVIARGGADCGDDAVAIP